MKSFHNYDAFLEAEDDVTKETLSCFKKDIELYQCSFDMLMETILYLSEHSIRERTSSDAKAVIFAFLPRIVQSMQSFRVLNLKGYYYDALVILRSFVESLGLCAYFALNEDEAENWMKGKDVQVSKIKLADHISTLLSTEGSEMKHLYGDLCNYVHTNIRAIVSFVSKIDHESSIVALKFIPELDKEKFEKVSPLPSLTLSVLSEIFKSELAEKREKILKFIKQYLAETEPASSAKKEETTFKLIPKKNP